MWIFLRHGFVSAVEDKDDSECIVVRARSENILKELFPYYKIRESSTSDYKYRVFVPRLEFAQVVQRQVEEISYTNFKASVSDTQLAMLYHRIWVLGVEYLK